METAQDVAGDLARISDEDLMARYRESSHPDDFRELVRRFERELFRYPARYLGDSALADDVFQNTFLQVHLKRGLYESGRPVRPWLYSIATHQAVDALRKLGRHPTLSLDQAQAAAEADNGSALAELLVSEAPGPLASLQGREREDWVRAAVARLPEALRQTLIMAYYQDMKYRDIAEALNIPVGTVKSRLHSALARLSEMAGSSLSDEHGSVP